MSHEEGKKAGLFRDKTAAKMIDKTLEIGELGIMFFGLAHSLERFFPKDIKIIDLTKHLPTNLSKWLRTGARGA